MAVSPFVRFSITYSDTFLISFVTALHMKTPKNVCRNPAEQVPSRILEPGQVSAHFLCVFSVVAASMSCRAKNGPVSTQDLKEIQMTDQTKDTPKCGCENTHCCCCCSCCCQPKSDAGKPCCS